MAYPPRKTGKWQLLGWMPLAEFEALKANIAATGRVQQPLVLDEAGNLLDGHHRQHAVDLLRDEGVKIALPEAVVVGALTNEQKHDFVLSVNLVRRHLSRKERREIIADALRRTPDRANNWLAEICGCDKKTVQSVRRRLESMCEIPTLTSFRRRNGKTYPHARVLTRTLGERARATDNLRRLGDGAPKTTLGLERLYELGRRKRIEEIVATYVPSLPNDIRIVQSDFRKLRVKKSSVNLIFTDPLWHKRHVKQWTELGEFADRVLCDGGVLAAYTGVMFLDKIMAGLSRKLNYLWTCCIGFRGGSVYVDRIRGRSAWRPIVLFVKGEYRRSNGFHDFMQSGNKEKDFHQFQQSFRECERFLRTLTDSGDLVCDPFGGSFTTAVAAAKNGRRFIGCDLDADCVQVGRYRVAEELGIITDDTDQPETVSISRQPVRSQKRSASAG